MNTVTRSAMLALLVLAPGAAHAVTLGQIDTFDDGTTMGWFVPGVSPNPPANEPSGGPAGAGDAYLKLVATGGSGPGARLSVLNASQWTGDYVAAGVTTIRMDVNNFGSSDLYLRLLFEDFEAPGPPVNLALSAEAVFVPSGSGWTTVAFPVTASDLVVPFGTAGGALADVDTLRIFHNPDPAFPGPGAGIPAVTVTLGVDNVTAAVPEPATLGLLVAGFAALGLGWPRRRGPV